MVQMVQMVYPTYSFKTSSVTLARESHLKDARVAVSRAVAGAVSPFDFLPPRPPLLPSRHPNLHRYHAGAKWGIKTTLLTGLSLQIVGISVLYAWQTSWSEPGENCLKHACMMVLEPGRPPWEHGNYL